MTRFYILYVEVCSMPSNVVYEDGWGRYNDGRLQVIRKLGMCSASSVEQFWMRINEK